MAQLVTCLFTPHPWVLVKTPGVEAICLHLRPGEAEAGESLGLAPTSIAGLLSSGFSERVHQKIRWRVCDDLFKLST